MAIRRIRSLLIVLCICSTGVGFAQSGPGWNQGPGYAPGPMMPQGGGFASPQFAPAGYHGPPQPMMSAGYEPPLPGSKEAMVNQMCYPDYATSNEPEERQLGILLKHVFDRSWIRLEYLHWDLEDPGNVVIGADPILNANGRRRDPRELDIIFDNTSGLPLGVGFAPDLDSVSLNDNSGIRGTFGREDSWGTFIMDFWGIEQAGETLELTSLLNDQQPFFFLTTPLNQNGRISNFALLSDARYSAQVETGLWGTNIEARLNTGLWPTGMRVQTILGANFTQVHDVMTLVTGFDNQGFDPVLTSTLRSDVQNNLFGPTIGMNADFEFHRLTFGLTPKVAFSTSRVRRRVATTDFAAIGDSISREDVDYEFAPILSLNASAKLRVSESFSVFVSWDGSWFSRIARAPNSIDYNDNLNTPQTDIGTRRNLESLTVSGLSVGGELLLY